jgi:hypothetical protein
VNVHSGKLSSRSDHRKHDRVLVSRLAMDDAYPGEVEEAVRLVASCSDCAALASDIRSISTSLAQLPAPSRSRDFTISIEQAEQLSGSRLSRWLRTLSTPGWSTLRPVAGVALSIGLVMAVVGGALPNQRPVFEDVGQILATPTEEAAAGDAQAPELQPGAAASPFSNPAPAAGGPDAPLFAASEDPTTLRYENAYIEESTAPQDDASQAEGLDLDKGAAVQPAATADPARNLLIYAGLAVAALSLGLLALAWAARRWFADPLLR